MGGKGSDSMGDKGIDHRTQCIRMVVLNEGFVVISKSRRQRRGFAGASAPNAALLLVRELRQHGGVRARRARERAAVTDLRLDVADDGACDERDYKGLHAFPSNITRDEPPITRDYTPSLLILQGVTLQLQGIILLSF